MDAFPQDDPVHKHKKFSLSLEQAIEGLKPHDHICLIYETRSEQFAALLPYFKAGLDRGERCVYIADENTADQVKKALGKVMDVEKEEARGALSIIGKKDAYLLGGYFEPGRMLSLLKENYIQARSEGFSALRVSGEMTWALGDDPGVDRLLEYETKLNEFFPEYDVLAICQYNARRFSPEILVDVIRSHPLVIYGSMVCRNHYYVPPEEFFREDQPRMEVKRLLDNIVQTEFRERALKKANLSLRETLNKVKLAEERIARLNKLYLVLSLINQMIVHVRDRQELVEHACRIVTEQGLFRFAWVGLLDEKTMDVVPAAKAGFEEGYLDGITITVKDEPAGRGPAGTAIREGRHVCVNDIEQDPSMLPWKEEALKRGYRSCGAFPIALGGKVIGAYMVYSPIKGYFNEEEVNLLDELAGDISFALQNRQAEEALVESEGKFRVLVEGSLVGVYVLQDGKINYANPRLAEIFGYEKEEMIGKSVMEMIAPEDRRLSLKKMMEILSGASTDNRHFFSAYTKEGRLIDIEVLGSKTVYSGRPALIGTLQDISESRRYEEGLRHEVAVSSALLDASRITSAALNWDDLSERVVELLNNFIPNSGISIFMTGADGFLVPQKALGRPEKMLAVFYSMRVRPQEIPAIEQVIKACIPISVSRERLSAMFPEYIISALDLEEVIIVPIIARQKVAGFLAANFASLPEDDRVREIMLGVAGQLGIAYENIRLYEETQNKSLNLAKKMEALKVLHEIDRMILSTLDRDEMLSKVSLQIKRLVPAEAGAVIMYAEDTGSCHFVCGWGMEIEKGAELSKDSCLEQDFFRTRKTVVRGSLHEDERLSRLDLAFISAGIKSDMVVPIISKGTPAGFIRLGSSRIAGFSLEDVEAAEKLTYQVGIAIENSTLLADLEDMLVNVVKAMASAIDAKSPWTKGHSERVTGYAVAIARGMGLGAGDVDRLKLAGLLHDIGKIGTSDSVLNKPGKLTPDEFAEMRLHPGRGAEILSHIKQFADIIPVVLHHHESWDGTGYPMGLKGSQIPLMARIMCVADTFDAITADRPYRPARDKDMAVAEFKRCSGTQFDPKVVDVFLKILSQCGAKKPPFPLQAA